MDVDCGGCGQWSNRGTWLKAYACMVNECSFCMHTHVVVFTVSIGSKLSSWTINMKMLGEPTVVLGNIAIPA